MKQPGIYREDLIAKQNACGAATGPSSAGGLEAAQSELQQVFSNADQEIGRLEFVLSELERKLQPLLSPSCVKEDKRPLQNRNSEVTQGLQMAILRVSTSADRIQDVLSRLVV